MFSIRYRNTNPWGNERHCHIPCQSWHWRSSNDNVIEVSVRVRLSSGLFLSLTLDLALIVTDRTPVRALHQDVRLFDTRKLRRCQLQVIIGPVGPLRKICCLLTIGRARSLLPASFPFLGRGHATFFAPSVFAREEMLGGAQQCLPSLLC